MVIFRPASVTQSGHAVPGGQFGFTVADRIVAPACSAVYRYSRLLTHRTDSRPPGTWPPAPGVQSRGTPGPLAWMVLLTVSRNC
jgi:hypothetical protein